MHRRAIISCLALLPKSKMNCISVCGLIVIGNILNNIIVSNTIYDEIAEATENLETVQTQIKAIKEQKISRKRIFEFLELFDIIYNEFTEFEKKEFLHSFIKKIEIYPEPLENGQILKSIQFRFPVYYQGNEADMFIPNFENTVECVVLMSRVKDWQALKGLKTSGLSIRL